MPSDSQQSLTLDGAREALVPGGEAPSGFDNGHHLDMDEKHYFAIDAANASTLKHFASSPMHARSVLDRPHMQTPQMMLGSALHAAVLEPDRFKRHWLRGIKVDRRTKQGKADWAAFEAESVGRQILKPEEHDKVLVMREAILSHPISARLHDKSSVAESVGLWNDPETSQRCKMRMDHLVQRKGRWIISDVKTTSRSAAPSQFVWTAINFGWHLQAAHYWNGWNQITSDDLPISFDFIVVETEPPHGVAVYRASHDFLELGRFWLEKYMAQYSECKQTGVWAGYPQRVIELEPPKRAMFDAIEHGAENLMGGLVKADD